MLVTRKFVEPFPVRYTQVGTQQSLGARVAVELKKMLAQMAQRH